jgi:hypothetical protein
MGISLIRISFIALIIILLILHIILEIKKDCKKDPKQCKTRKNRIIGTSLILCGIGIMSPGLTWIPAGIATKKYGRNYGTKILELTIAIGVVISIAGGIIHFL